VFLDTMLIGGFFTMSKFLTTKEISGDIMNIIRNAKEKIVIVSPYIKMDSTYINHLEMRAKSGIRILLIFGKDRNQFVHSDLQRFSNQKNVQCYFCENLHAKCYANEKKAIVTSMNLYTYSEITNHEMGIVVETPKDKDLYNEIMMEVRGIYSDSTLVSECKTEEFFDEQKKSSFLSKKKTQASISRYHKHKGYCIRCGEEIPFNPDRPYCRDCFEVWNRYSDVNYLESFCHCCGDDLLDASMRKPLCRSCFKENSSLFHFSM
jgi:RNA polymerase-binding transcription factor DksA